MINCQEEKVGKNSPISTHKTMFTLRSVKCQIKDKTPDLWLTEITLSGLALCVLANGFSFCGFKYGQ